MDTKREESKQVSKPNEERGSSFKLRPQNIVEYIDDTDEKAAGTGGPPFGEQCGDQSDEKVQIRTVPKLEEAKGNEAVIK